MVFDYGLSWTSPTSCPSLEVCVCRGSGWGAAYTAFGVDPIRVAFTKSVSILLKSNSIFRIGLLKRFVH